MGPEGHELRIWQKKETSLIRGGPGSPEMGIFFVYPHFHFQGDQIGILVHLIKKLGLDVLKMVSPGHFNFFLGSSTLVHYHDHTDEKHL